MKIFTNNAVYVQKNDIAFLNQTDLDVPASIFLKIFGGGITRNRYDFIKFEDSVEMEFFRDIDWIVDYDEVKDLTDEQIIELGKDLSNQKNEIAKSFNSMSMEEQMENMDMFYQCEKLDFKMYSLRDLIWFRQGKLQFELPRDLECSELCERPKRNGLRRSLKKTERKNKGFCLRMFVW